MWCDQGSLPFISTAAQCGLYVRAVWLQKSGWRDQAAALIHKALQDCVNGAIEKFDNDYQNWTKDNPKPELRPAGPFNTLGGILAGVLGTAIWGGTVASTGGGVALGYGIGALGEYLDRLGEWLQKQAPLWDTLAKDKAKCYEQYGPAAYPWAY
jgi:hypothetical protein